VTPGRPKVDPVHDAILFEMGKLEHAEELVKSPNIEQPYSAPGLLLDTSSFTADGWQGSFYPTWHADAQFPQFKTVVGIEGWARMVTTDFV
jgi:hypothetical protein